MIKLIAIDLDDTLLNKKKEISSRNVSAINNAVTNNVKIVLATGRPYFREKLNLLDDNQVVITLNGGYICNATNNKTLYENVLNNQDIVKIIEVINNTKLCFNVYCGDNIYTEKLEEKLNELLPSAKVVRMDQDTTRRKGAHEQIIEDFKNEKYNILLGTQMISKGLDFPKVTLVGVINADTTLNIPNFKASENTFSLLHQVAGRSGRSTSPGEVIIQTFNPDNYVIKCVKENSYDKFYLYEMNFRKKLKYPPYYYLVSLKIIGKEYEKTIDASKKVKTFLDKNLTDVITLGPTTAQVFKFNNEYRMQKNKK